jgi:glutamine synthetase
MYHLSPSELSARGIPTLPSSLKEAMDALACDDGVKSALGPHVYSKLTDWQQADWDSYRTSVTDWEKSRYFGII